MTKLHIVQAGIDNGDLAWLREAAVTGNASNTWIVPKSAQTGDEVVVFVRSLGFVATAKFLQEPSKRPDWNNRYGASIGDVHLIEPPISLVYIRSGVPELTWAKYPRSITTPDESIAEQIRLLVSKRLEKGVDALDEGLMSEANLGELRMLALHGAMAAGRKSTRKSQYHIRSCASGVMPWLDVVVTASCVERRLRSILLKVNHTWKFITFYNYQTKVLTTRATSLRYVLTAIDVPITQSIKNH
jgi:hypothetical protein